MAVRFLSFTVGLATTAAVAAGFAGTYLETASRTAVREAPEVVTVSAPASQLHAPIPAITTSGSAPPITADEELIDLHAPEPAAAHLPSREAAAAEVAARAAAEKAQQQKAAAAAKARKKREARQREQQRRARSFSETPYYAQESYGQPRGMQRNGSMFGWR